MLDCMAKRTVLLAAFLAAGCGGDPTFDASCTTPAEMICIDASCKAPATRICIDYHDFPPGEPINYFGLGINYCAYLHGAWSTTTPCDHTNAVGSCRQLFGLLNNAPNAYEVTWIWGLSIDQAKSECESIFGTFTPS
jgi:hypothetical protein